MSFVAQFAASVIISRFFLDPSEVGLFSIAMAATLIVAVLQDMGVTRFISGQREMQPEFIRDYAGLAVGLGILVAGSVTIAAPFIADFYDMPDLTGLLRILGASYLLVPFALVSSALLIRDMDFKGLFKVNASAALIGSGVAVALAATGYGPAALAWGALAGAGTKALVSQLLRTALPRLPHSWSAVAPMARFGGASSIINISGAIGQRSQDLIVGGFLGVAATGLFTRASGLAGQLSILMTGAVSAVFYPAFARKRDAGEELGEPYLHLVACNTALTWAALIGLAVAAEPVVLLLYGDVWAGSAPLLQWFALAELLFVAVPLQMDVPLLLGKIRRLIWINLLDTAAAVTVLAIGCFIGLLEAALSRIIYGMIWWSIYANYQSHLLGFKMSALMKIYARSGICAVGAGLPLIIAGQFGVGGANMGFVSLIALSGAGVLIWLGLLAATRHPAWSEVRLAIDTNLPPILAKFGLLRS